MRTTVKIAATVLIGALLFATPASAHGRGDDFGGLGNFGGLGFGFGRGDGLGGLGLGFGHGDFGGLGFGLGLGFLNSGVDRIQEGFENRLDSLQTRYDDGLANNT